MWHLGFALAALLVPIAQTSYASIEWMKYPSKRLILRPKSFLGLSEGTVVPTELTIGEPPDNNSPSMLSSFTLNPDSTIAWGLGCVEASGFKNGDAVHVNRCTGGKTQRWNWIPYGHGRNMIQLQETDMCMDVVDEGFDLKEAPVRLRTCEREITEAWRLADSGVVSPSRRMAFPFGTRHVMIFLVALAGLGAMSFRAWLRRAQVQTCTPTEIQVPMRPENVPRSALRTRSVFATAAAESMVTVEDLPDEPSPNLGWSASQTVHAVCLGLQHNDHPTEDTGLQRLYYFLTAQGRVAIAPPPPKAGRQGKVQLEDFMRDAASPALGTLLLCDRFELIGTPIISPPGPARGAIAQVTVDVFNQPVDLKKSVAEEEIETLETLINADDHFLERFLDASQHGRRPPPLPLRSREKISALPRKARFVVKLEQQRPPPLQGCWLIAEFRPMQISKFQIMNQGGEEFEGDED